MPVPVQSESASFLSVYINVCVGFESVRAKDGAREAPYTQARRWEYGGSRLKSLFLGQECAGQREVTVFRERLTMVRSSM